MTDIPDDAITRRVEDPMQSDSELNHAQPSAEVAAGVRDSVNHLGSQFVSKLTQIGFRKPSQILRHSYFVEERLVLRQWPRRLRAHRRHSQLLQLGALRFASKIFKTGAASSRRLPVAPLQAL